MRYEWCLTLSAFDVSSVECSVLRRQQAQRTHSGQRSAQLLPFSLLQRPGLHSLTLSVSKILCEALNRVIICTHNRIGITNTTGGETTSTTYAPC